ncbi:hypothetical protein MRB53_041037 [Persea americana]|nr:hypothetical protein MRB53_041037 [Persea americana]
MILASHTVTQLSSSSVTCPAYRYLQDRCRAGPKRTLYSIGLEAFAASIWSGRRAISTIASRLRLHITTMDGSSLIVTSRKTPNATSHTDSMCCADIMSYVGPMAVIIPVLSVAKSTARLDEGNDRDI